MPKIRLEMERAGADRGDISIECDSWQLDDPDTIMAHDAKGRLICICRDWVVVRCFVEEEDDA